VLLGVICGKICQLALPPVPSGGALLDTKPQNGHVANGALHNGESHKKTEEQNNEGSNDPELCLAVSFNPSLQDDQSDSPAGIIIILIVLILILILVIILIIITIVINIVIYY
jgi:hypothetical protein